MIVALVDCRSVEIHSRICTHAHLLHCRCYKCSHGLGEVDLWSTEKFIWKRETNVLIWGTRICLSFDLHEYRFEHSLQTLLVTLTALPLTMTHISFTSGVPLHRKVYYYHVSVSKSTSYKQDRVH